MKKVRFNKNLIFSVSVILLAVVVMAMSVRGNLGNPKAEDLSFPQWKEGGPLELSPERGRFALTYSVAEDHSLQFSLPLARFVVPDLAVSPSGQYVSLFAPGVSFLVLPGYFLGKALGASQIGAYAVISLIALFNGWLIYLIVLRFSTNRWAAALGGLVFLFATPAFAYAVNLYQHHVSVFFLLAGIYILARWNNWVSLITVWTLCGLSIVIDNPNFFLMFPLVIFVLGRIMVLKRSKLGLSVNINPWYFPTVFALAIPLFFLVWFNQASHGDPFKLSGTLPSVAAIGQDGRPMRSQTAELLGIQDHGESVEKSAVTFFKTRNLLQGFYIHLLSPDRGIIYFTPVILLGIWGLRIVWRRYSELGRLFVSIILVNLLLYSMWGDPWGGWAFGSRYLIPTYALLAVGLGVLLDNWRRSWSFIILFLFFFIYSAGVNTLGALTTSANPPQAEVLSLEKVSGHEEKYTYARNWQYLNEKGSKSFVYQTIGKNHISAKKYYYLILAGVLATGLLLLIFLVKTNYEKLIKNKKS